MHPCLKGPLTVIGTEISLPGPYGPGSTSPIVITCADAETLKRINRKRRNRIKKHFLHIAGLEKAVYGRDLLLDYRIA